MSLEPAPSNLVKYNPDQPRVPSGSGKTSGQRTSGEFAPVQSASDQSTPKSGRTVSASAIALPEAMTAGTAAEGLFGTAHGSTFLTGLGVLAEAVGAAAVLGLIFVPSPNSQVSQGPVPGDPDLRYFLNNDEGSLRFVRQTDAGLETVAVAHQGRDGIFFELETGRRSRGRSAAASSSMPRLWRTQRVRRRRARGRRPAPPWEAKPTSRNSVRTQVLTSRTAPRLEPSPIRHKSAP